MTDLFDPDLEELSFEPERRRRWPGCLVLLIGLALGLAAGLGYTWGLNPVQFYNTDPVDLRPQYKETWILLVAAAYRQDGDLDRALSRLAGLDDPQIGQTVADLTEEYIAAGKSATRVRALVGLADALGARTPPMLVYLVTPEPTPFFTPTPPPPTATVTPSPTATATATPTPTPTATPTVTRTPAITPTVTSTATRTPTATPTPRPTATRRPTATPVPPYTLEERQRICPSPGNTPRIQVFVQTEEGAGLPGSEVWVTWSGGVDRFITGLKPEIGLGYADFDMVPGIVYAVAVGDPTQQIASGLRAEACPSGEGGLPLSSWRLVITASSAAFTPTPTPTPTSPPTLTPTPTAPPTATATPTPIPTSTRPLP
jgi:hypothetical protein